MQMHKMDKLGILSLCALCTQHFVDTRKKKVGSSGENATTENLAVLGKLPTESKSTMASRTSESIIPSHLEILFFPVSLKNFFHGSWCK